MSHVMPYGNAFLSFALVALASGVTFAGGPQVAFDFGRIAECVEIAGEDALLTPGEKLVELKLRVSVHLLAGKISDVEEVRIEVGDRDNRMRVHSFAPSTQMASHFGGDIEWSKTTEEGHSLGASLGGELPAPVGGLIAHVTPTISGGTKNSETITEKQLRLAPKFAVVASGTIGQEHGVFFKLRSSSQSSLEGTHDLTVRFIVPEKWRGDSVRVCCQATGTEKVFWMKQQATWAHTCGPVALYLAGDAEARQAAIRYVSGKERG
ncbi:hypothetical protein [Bythopirellula polymerisocia]|uniref:Uncharacterized protein n=1 Tax=Bythopirellula polymerisocia TaxID=2528003 RepID=A0A5C6CZN9_9BACT|nr:hypothetical protein [Bythopirellula polymerisocia]TWU28129.1 hypothetical protein Pla144_14160 [Bythopirellula polymerisocia]